MELSGHKTFPHERWKRLFDKYDPEGYGRISSEDFLVALSTKDFRERIDTSRRAELKAKVLEYGTSFITLEQFLSVMSDKRSSSCRYGVHFKDQDIWIEQGLKIEDSKRNKVLPLCFDKMVKAIAHHFLHDDRDRKYYADSYSCRPPPLFILIITLIELGFFTYYTVAIGEVTTSGPVPIDSMFIYRPDKRSEVWRFVFYMVLHAGWLHLIFNLLVQLLVGLPLEMVHGSVRIGTVYMAGVLAGSLGTSVFDSDVYLVGASGGVYALLAAHLANVVLNYNQMELGMLRLFGIFVVASADVGIAIYDRYSREFEGPVSYVAHLTGALAGLTIGLLVLKNFEQKLHEQLMWWIALGVYAACILFALLFNFFN